MMPSRVASSPSPSGRAIRQLFSTKHAAADILDSWRNPAAMLHGASDLRLEDTPLPDQVAQGLIRLGHFVVQAPIVIGHECAGEVAEVGPGVTTLQARDRVALEPGIPCWSHRMSSIVYNRPCLHIAVPPVHGSLAKYVDHPADCCFQLPESLAYEQGAMVEPLSCAVHVCMRAGVGPGKRVAVLGAGPIAGRGTCSGPVSGQKQAAAETVESLRAVFHDGPDIVSSTLTTAREAVAPGGTVVQVGLREDKCCIPAMQAVFKEFPLCLSFLAEGKIQTEPLITHRFGFSQADILEGFETAAAAAKTGAIKVMFSW
ncbi:TPA: hypothetical protein ACH3X2_009469 [Trebouxia sp. C0005]